MSYDIGEFLEKPGKMRGEWRIPDFFSLKGEAGTFYMSPKFLFLDSAWRLKLYPNGRTFDTSEGIIGLYLCRLDCGSSRTVGFTLGIRKADGKEEIALEVDSQTFQKSDWGLHIFLERSDLLRRKEELAPSDVITVTCTLRSDTKGAMEVSLFNRLWNLSQNLKKFLASQKNTDVLFKLKDGEIPAHRMILESRSTVFNRMFEADMQETQTGEVNVQDEDEGVFKVVLYYVYSGDPEGLSTDNMCEVYKIAHRYELQELRHLCTEFMQKSLSVDSIYDIFAIANLYQEKNLKKYVKDYFAENKSDIFKSEKWEIFKLENPTAVIELMECALGRND